MLKEKKREANCENISENNTKNAGKINIQRKNYSL